MLCHFTNLNKNPTHRKGRPLRPPTSREVESHEEHHVVPTKQPKKRTLKNLKSRRRMSALEKLPTELLQQIFIYCLSLDLPRASPIIAGALSHKSVYLRIVLASFSPSWDLWCDRNEETEQLYKRRNDVALQSATLRCRWANLDLLLEARQIWLDNITEPSAFQPPYFRESRVSDNLDGNSVSFLVSRTIQAFFDEDFADFCAICEDLDGPPLQEICKWDFISIPAKEVEMPISLLAGPWTEEMIKHFFWLVKSGIQIDWYKSTNGEVAITGLRSAIMDGDIRAIHLLHWAGMQDKLEMETVIWAIQNAGGDRRAVVSHLLRLSFELMSDSEARKLGRALSNLRDEARQDDDQEKLDFFEFIRNCERVRSADNVHV